MEIHEKEFKKLIKRIDEMKKAEHVDLSTEEDLSIAIMNLISLEEHFFFTGERTGNSEYFDTLLEIREARKQLLARMIDKHEGETWCISKHLLATTMRLIEVGTKLQSDGDKEKAKETFDYAFKIYSIFWGLRLKLLKMPEVKKMAKEEGEKDKAWSLQEIVDKLVDCCDE
ncbi:hypothetical protein CL629_03870 [bacterium]|nr:hypothetical protein [bacterium]|tara:strand:+ start:18492 stop:19004 length:513 start_codon:yes stop_codon:yes gene_type:complete